MADSSADCSTTSAPRRSVSLRVTLLLMVLFVETLALRWQFDVRVIRLAAGWWSGVLAGPSALARVAIAFSGAIVLLSGLRLGDHFRELLAQIRDHRQWRFWLLLQLTSFGAVVAIASHVASIMGETSAMLIVWRVLGSVAAAAALGCWFAGIAPPRYWLRLAFAESKVLLAGGVVAAAAWWLGEWTQTAWKPLNDWTFQAVGWILRLFYPQTTLLTEQRVVGTPQFVVSISPECSGYEGIGLVCVFLAIFFGVFRHRLRFPEAWLLWPIGIVAIWFGNILRIVALVMIGTHYSPDVAIRGFHSQAGWLFFNLVSLSLMAAALRLPLFVRNSELVGARARGTPVSAYLLPLLVLIALNMLVASISDDFDRFYPLKVLVTVAVLWRYRAEYRALGWSWSWHAALNGVVVFAVWILLARFGEHEDSEIPLRLEQLATFESWLWPVFRTIGSVGTVPLVEELAFRGYLMRRLASADFDEVEYAQTPWWSVAVSSLLFGMMHGRWLAGTSAGVCYAIATRRRGKLSDAILAHSVTNALIAADVLVLDDWWLW